MSLKSCVLAVLIASQSLFVSVANAQTSSTVALRAALSSNKGTALVEAGLQNSTVAAAYAEITGVSIARLRSLRPEAVRTTLIEKLRKGSTNPAMIAQSKKVIGAIQSGELSRSNLNMNARGNAVAEGSARGQSEVRSTLAEAAKTEHARKVAEPVADYVLSEAQSGTFSMQTAREFQSAAEAYPARIGKGFVSGCKEVSKKALSNFVGSIIAGGKVASDKLALTAMAKDLSSRIKSTVAEARDNICKLANPTPAGEACEYYGPSVHAACAL